MQFSKFSSMVAKRSHRFGFSLIEILFVMLIIGVLAVLAIPEFKNQMRLSRGEAETENLRTIQSAKLAWMKDNPGLDLPKDVGAAKAALLPYLEYGWPESPWGVEYEGINNINVAVSSPVNGDPKYEPRGGRDLYNNGYNDLGLSRNVYLEAPDVEGILAKWGVTTVSPPSSTIISPPPSAETWDLNLAVLPEGSGTTTGAGKYNAGELATFDAFPADASWRFSGWEGDLAGKNKNDTISGPPNRSGVARMERVTHNLTVVADPAEGGSVTPAGVENHVYGSSASVYATANSGWRFIGFSGDTQGGTPVVKDDSGSLTGLIMTQDRTVTAKFEQYASLTVRKVVSNPSGKPLPVTDFRLVLTGPSGYSLNLGTSQVGGEILISDLLPGTYTLTEPSVPQYFSASAFPSLSLEAGEYGVLEITNTYVPPVTYIFTGLVSPPNSGSISPSNSSTRSDREVVHITTVGNTGWVFKGFSGDIAGGSFTGQSGSVTMNQDRTVTANYELAQYPLTVAVEPAEGGTGFGGGTYSHGENVNFWVTPTDGWRLSSWTGDYTGSNLAAYILMDRAKTVTAHMVRNQYPLTVAVEPAEGGTGFGGGTYSHGENVNFGVTPTDGWRLSSWTGDYTGSKLEDSILMDRAKTVTANMVRNLYPLTVAVEPAEGGTGFGGGTYSHGENVNFGVTPADGWELSFWTGDYTGSNLEDSILMDGAKTVTAHMVPISGQYPLTVVVEPAEGGTGFGGGLYSDGENVNFGVTPNDGWELSSWTGDYTGSNLEDSILMDGAKTVTANMVPKDGKNPLFVRVEPAEGGTGFGGGTYSPGDTAYFGVTPTNGWRLSSWTGDYTGSNLEDSILMDGAKTVTAHMVPVMWRRLQVLVSPSGAATPVGDGSYIFGSTQSYSFSGKGASYDFIGWSGGATGTANPGSILMNEDKTVVANFIQIDKTGPDSLRVGQSGTFTITVSNPSEISSGEKTVVDTLPAGLTATGASIISGPGSVSLSGNTVTWNGILLEGESVVISIPFTMDTEDTKVNTVTVGGGSASHTVTVTPPHLGDLVVRKTFSGNPVPFSSTFLISITGPNGFSETRTADYTGGQWTFFGITPGVYTITESDPGPGYTVTGEGDITVVAGGSVTATINNHYMVSPNTGRLTVRKVIAGDPFNGSMNFTIRITGPDGWNQVIESPVAGGTWVYNNVPAGEYTITEDDPTPFVSSGTGVFTVPPSGEVTATVTNTYTPGYIKVSKIASGDPFPDWAKFKITVSGDYYSGDFDLPIGGSTGLLAVPPGNYTVSEYDYIKFSGVTTTGTGSYRVLPGETTSVVIDNIKSGSGVAPNYSLTKSLNGPTTVKVGDSVEFVISFSGDPAATSGSVTISDVMPSGIFLKGISVKAYDTSFSSVEGLATFGSDGFTVVFDEDNLPAFGEIHVYGTAKRVGMQTNMASITPGNSSTSTVKVVDVTIDKSASKHTVFFGEEFYYTVSVKAGSLTSDPVVVLDSIPSEFTVLSVNMTQGSYTSSGQDYVLDFGKVDRLQKAEFKVRANILPIPDASVNPSWPGYFTTINTAILSDPFEGEDSAEVFIRPLTITKSRSVDATNPLVPWTWTVTVDAGTYATTSEDVIVYDELPLHYVLSSITMSSGSYSISGKTVTLNFGKISGSATAIFVGYAGLGTEGLTLTNTATLNTITVSSSVGILGFYFPGQSVVQGYHAYVYGDKPGITPTYEGSGESGGPNFGYKIDKSYYAKYIWHSYSKESYGISKSKNKHDSGSSEGIESTLSWEESLNSSGNWSFSRGSDQKSGRFKKKIQEPLRIKWEDDVDSWFDISGSEDWYFYTGKSSGEQFSELDQTYEPDDVHMVDRHTMKADTIENSSYISGEGYNGFRIENAFESYYFKETFGSDSYVDESNNSWTNRYVHDESCKFPHWFRFVSTTPPEGEGNYPDMVTDYVKFNFTDYKYITEKRGNEYENYWLSTKVDNDSDVIIKPYHKYGTYGDFKNKYTTSQLMSDVRALVPPPETWAKYNANSRTAAASVEESMEATSSRYSLSLKSLTIDTTLPAPPPGFHWVVEYETENKETSVVSSKSQRQDGPRTHVTETTKNSVDLYGWGPLRVIPLPDNTLHVTGEISPPPYPARQVGVWHAGNTQFRIASSTKTRLLGFKLEKK